MPSTRGSSANSAIPPPSEISCASAQITDQRVDADAVDRELDRRLTAVATGQLGLLSRRQANGVGVFNAQLRSRVSSGSLLQVGTDTFRLPGALTDAHAELLALMLDVGGEVWASGPTTAALRLIAGAGLPTPLTQQVLTRAGDRLVRVDFRFAGTPVVSSWR